MIQVVIGVAGSVLILAAVCMSLHTRKSAKKTEDAVQAFAAQLGRSDRLVKVMKDEGYNEEGTR